MRSHMRASCLGTEEKEKVENSGRQLSFRAGYVLRENPKKTWRLSDFVGEDIVSSSSRHCSECGKEFPSWKAFFDHIKLHTGMTHNNSVEVEDMDEQEDGSLSSQKICPESFSDGGEPLPLPTVPRRKRRPNRAPTIMAASSSTITDHESEQEDVAISLMMLSRDTSGYCVSAVSAAGESSDKNLVVEEHLGEEVSGMKRAATGSRYQCATCNRIFHSYHALGGHRASHKRIRSSCQIKSKDDAIKNAGVDDGTLVEHLAGVNQKCRTHECFVCGKVFASGHTLGGHRKSHLASNGGDGRRQMFANSELLDLNLPPQEDEGIEQFQE